MAQVYTDGQGFVHVDLRTSKSLARFTLENLTKNIRIPNTIIYEWVPRTSRSQFRISEDNEEMKYTQTSMRTLSPMAEQS